MATGIASGKTILIVDNDDSTRKAFEMVLSERGYEVALAASGQEALDYLRTRRPPDLIVLDMLMPVMDGWQFLRHRNAQWPSVPVLLQTALAVASEAWAASLGACGWLRKPIDPALAADAVRKCLAEGNQRTASSSL